MNVRKSSVHLKSIKILFMNSNDVPTAAVQKRHYLRANSCIGSLDSGITAFNEWNTRTERSVSFLYWPQPSQKYHLLRISTEPSLPIPFLLTRRTARYQAIQTGITPPQSRGGRSSCDRFGVSWWPTAESGSRRPGGDRYDLFFTAASLMSTQVLELTSSENLLDDWTNCWNLSPQRCSSFIFMPLDNL